MQIHVNGRKGVEVHVMKGVTRNMNVRKQVMMYVI
jgi:hypothetical protein